MMPTARSAPPSTQDLDKLAKVYAERSKQLAQQGEVHRLLAFLLTGLGGLALVVVGIGVLIISRSVARPLSAITATIKQVAEGAENVVVPHIDRADEIGALARAIRIFQEAMDRNRNLNSQVLQDSKAREERTRRIETSVEAFREAIGGVLRAVTDNASAMRDTAQSITKAASDASGRAVAAASATEQASSNVNAVAGAAEELSASVQEIGRQVRQSAGVVEQAGLRTEKSVSRNRKPRRGDPAHRWRAQSDPGDRRANQSAGAERDDRGSARRRSRARLRGGRP